MLSSLCHTPDLGYPICGSNCSLLRADICQCILFPLSILPWTLVPIWLSSLLTQFHVDLSYRFGYMWVLLPVCSQFSVRIAPHWDVCLKWLWDRWVPHLFLPSVLTSPYYLLFIHQIMSSYLQLCGQQHDRFPCPSPSPGVCPSSCLLNQWCHPIISSSVTLFSFCLQSFLASGSFPLSRLFTIGHQNIGASASVLPMSIVFRVDFL